MLATIEPFSHNWMTVYCLLWLFISALASCYEMRRTDHNLTWHDMLKDIQKTFSATGNKHTGREANRVKTAPEIRGSSSLQLFVLWRPERALWICSCAVLPFELRAETRGLFIQKWSRFIQKYPWFIQNRGRFAEIAPMIVDKSRRQLCVRRTDIMPLCNAESLELPKGRGREEKGPTADQSTMPKRLCTCRRSLSFL